MEPVHYAIINLTRQFMDKPDKKWHEISKLFHELVPDLKKSPKFNSFNYSTYRFVSAEKKLLAIIHEAVNNFIRQRLGSTNTEQIFDLFPVYFVPILDKRDELSDLFPTTYEFASAGKILLMPTTKISRLVPFLFSHLTIPFKGNQIDSHDMLDSYDKIVGNIARHYLSDYPYVTEADVYDRLVTSDSTLTLNEEFNKLFPEIYSSIRSEITRKIIDELARKFMSETNVDLRKRLFELIPSFQTSKLFRSYFQRTYEKIQLELTFELINDLTREIMRERPGITVADVAEHLIASVPSFVDEEIFPIILSNVYECVKSKEKIRYVRDLIETITVDNPCMTRDDVYQQLVETVPDFETSISLIDFRRMYARARLPCNRQDQNQNQDQMHMYRKDKMREMREMRDLRESEDFLGL